MDVHSTSIFSTYYLLGIVLDAENTAEQDKVLTLVQLKSWWRRGNKQARISRQTLAGLSTAEKHKAGREGRGVRVGEGLVT